MNRTQGRPPVRLIQLQSARSAPKQAPDFAPGTVARSTFTTTPPPTIPSKAGKGIRTLDIQLGKLTLYQLSYARELCSVYQWASCGWLLVAGFCCGCTRLVFTPPKPARLPFLLRSYS